jgi:hypothetical protein
MTIPFSAALVALQQGKKVARYTWPAGQFLYLVDGSTFEVNRAPLSEILPIGTKVVYRSHIDKMTTIYSGEKVFSYLAEVWLPTTEEMTAPNWRVVT